MSARTRLARSLTLSLGVLAAIASLAPTAAAALLSVRDFPSPAAALAAAHDGDRVYFPSPGPYQAPPGGWVIAKSLEIFGDGPGRDLSGASSIVPDADGNAFVLDSTAALANLHFHDLLVTARGAGSGRRAALRLTIPDQSPHALSGLRLERVTFSALAGDAVSLDGGARNAVLLVSLTDCEVNTCGGNGVTLRHVTTTTLLDGYYHDCRGYGLYAEAAGVRIIGAAFEHNQLGASAGDLASQVRLKLCHGFLALGCHFEEFAAADRPARTALTVEACRGGQVSASIFVKNRAGVPGSRGILILGGSRDIDVGANSWMYVDTLVAVRGVESNPGCTVRMQTALKTDANAAGVVEGAAAATAAPAASALATTEAPAPAGLDRTDLVGDLAPQGLVSAGGEGLVRVSVVVATRQPGAGKLAVRLEWNDGAPRTRDVIANFDLALASGAVDASCTVFLAAGQGLTCRTLGAGSAARYALHARAERL